MEKEASGKLNPTCGMKRCDLPATGIVHWPGKSVPACSQHEHVIVGLAETMGFRVEVTPTRLGEG